MAQSDDKPLDQEALAEAYNRALALEKAGDFDAAAKAYEEVLQIAPDDHGGAAVRLASMGRGAVPLKAPDAYVATLFDQHAEMFDTILVDQLGYDVPLQLREMLLEMDDAFNAERMLDLGCGTGLSADALDDMAAHKTGVDISENMIEVAYEKGDYDALFVGEAVRFLESTEEENWDLIVATDVLPYMGELERFLPVWRNISTPAGISVFPVRHWTIIVWPDALSLLAIISVSLMPNLTCAPCWTVTEWIASAVRTSLCVASKALRCRAISILHAAVDRLHREC